MRDMQLQAQMSNAHKNAGRVSAQEADPHDSGHSDLTDPVLPAASSFGDIKVFRREVTKAVKDAVLRQLARHGSPAVSNVRDVARLAFAAVLDGLMVFLSL